MDSSDRLGAIITVCMLAAFVAMLLLVSSCVMQQIKVNAPDQILQTKSEHILKGKCIEMHGDWDNNFNSCTFPKDK